VTGSSGGSGGGFGGGGIFGMIIFCKIPFHYFLSSLIINVKKQSNVLLFQSDLSRFD
jgi:hypothetical protein